MFCWPRTKSCLPTLDHGSGTLYFSRVWCYTVLCFLWEVLPNAALQLSYLGYFCHVYAVLCIWLLKKNRAERGQYLTLLQHPLNRNPLLNKQRIEGSLHRLGQKDKIFHRKHSSSTQNIAVPKMRASWDDGFSSVSWKFSESNKRCKNCCISDATKLLALQYKAKMLLKYYHTLLE